MTVREVLLVLANFCMTGGLSKKFPAQPGGEPFFDQVPSGQGKQDADEKGKQDARHGGRRTEAEIKNHPVQQHDRVVMHEI